MDKLDDSNSAVNAERKATAHVHVPFVQKLFHNFSKHHSTNSGDKNISSDDNPFNLEIGSAVQYYEKYGIIRWIGTRHGDKKVYARVEMVIIIS